MLIAAGVVLFGAFGFFSATEAGLDGSKTTPSTALPVGPFSRKVSARPATWTSLAASAWAAPNGASARVSAQSATAPRVFLFDILHPLPEFLPGFTGCLMSLQ
ncbi:hypothetical protein ASD21_21415 [Caulobacter sp. Root1455]|nr:hypothetical protein ASD21_21415 [Caulobacter sp. Root1455]